MLYIYLYICLVLCCALSSHAQLAKSWSKQLHGLPVKNVHLRDTVGVSNDDTSFVVWRVSDGSEIRKWSRVTGSIAQTWLDDSDRVVMIKSVFNRAPLVLYRISISSGETVDSLALPYVSGDFDPGGDVVQSDMSNDGRRLAISLWRLHFLPDGHSTEVQNDVYVIDLPTLSLGNKLPTLSHVRRRFESGDTRLTEYAAGDSRFGRTWSPSGQYSFDGTSLFNYPSKGLSVPLTRKRVEVIRWGEVDAVLLARTTNFPNTTGLISLLDVCADTTITSLAESELHYGVYAPYSLSHAGGGKSDGTVTLWHLPNLTSLSGRRVRVMLPTAPLKTDTLYSFQSITFPLDEKTTPLLDVGDLQLIRGPLFSIKNSGILHFRAGVATSIDTSWGALFDVDVHKRTTSEGVTRELATGKSSVVSASLSKDSRLLVSTKSGLTFLLDSTLRCSEGFAGPNSLLGSKWEGTEHIQLMALHDSSWSEDSPGGNDAQYTHTTATVNRVRLSDFSTVATDYVAFSRRNEAPPSFISMVDCPASEGLAFAFANISYLSGGGGLFIDKPGDSLDLKPLIGLFGWQHTSDPVYIPMGGAMNLDGTHGVFMYRTIQWPGSKYKRILAATAGVPEMEIVNDDYASSAALFINDTAAVLDEAIVKFNPSQFIQGLRFKGPFARSIPIGYGIAWDSEMFYRFNDNGTVLDSMNGPAVRPTCIVSLSLTSIACGLSDGTFRLYSDTSFSTVVLEPPISPPDTTTPSPSHSAPLSIMGFPTTTTLRLRSSLDSTHSESVFVLYDLTGRFVGSHTVATAPEYTVDLHSFGGKLTNGMYILQLSSAGKSASVLVSVRL